MSDNSTKYLEFSPILGVEKSCPEKFTFDINGSYVYQVGNPEHEFVPIFPLNWKIWFIPVFIISFVLLTYLTANAVKPTTDLHVYMILIMSAITSLIITIMATVLDMTKYEQPTRDFLRNL